jgi:hypothetical protein
MKITVNLSLTVHPEAKKIRHQNRQLQTEIARLIVERDHLKKIAAPQIFTEYQSKTGTLELRVFQFECDIRSFVRRVELATAALNRGEKPCYREIEKEIKTEFAAWHEQIAEQIRTVKAAKELEDLPTLTHAESRELQTLYRKLAFLLHPDIIDSTEERRVKLWRQAAEAYQNGDLQTLRTIRRLMGEESESLETGTAVKTLNILESLKTRNAKLKQICEKFLNEIDEIKTSAPYAWHKILDDAAQLEKYQNDLREKIEIQREKRQQLVEHWAEILRFAEDSANVQLPDEPLEIFAGNTDSWAEITYEL